MENTPNVYHLVAFVFEGKDSAKKIVKEVKKQNLLDGMKVLNSVVVSRSEEGKVSFSEIRGMSGKKGRRLGAGAGLVLGVLGSGGLLLPVIAGAAAGNVLAKHGDKKTLSKEMQEITDVMTDDSSAVFALLQNKDAEQMITDMEGFNANVITITLGDEEAQIIETMIAAEFEIDPEVLDLE